MRIEADVKARMKQIFDANGVWWFMYVPTGYGVAGIPDFITCVPTTITPDMVGKTYGLFYAPEAKFGNNKPSALQSAQMRGIRAAHGVSVVINEKNVEDTINEFKKCL